MSLKRLQEAPRGLFYFAVIPACGLILSWWQPHHVYPWISWHSEIPVFFALAILFFTFIKYAYQSNREYVLVPFNSWPILLLICIVLIQALIGKIGYVGDALILELYLVAALFSMILGYQFDGHLDILARIIIVGAMGALVVGLSQAFAVDVSTSWVLPQMSWRRPGSNLGQPNQFGTLLLWGIASAIHLYSKHEIRITLLAILLLMLLWGVAVTESRTAMVGMPVIVIWYYLKSKKENNVHWFIPVLGLLLALAFCLSWPKLITIFHEGGGVEAIQSAKLNTEGGSRFIVWPQLWDAVWLKPIGGWGLRGVSVALNAVLHNYTSGDPFTYSHNIVLDLLVGIGIPLAVIVTSAFAVWMVRRVIVSRDSGAVYGMALLFPFVIHSLLEFPFAYSYFLMVACFIVGVLVRGEESPKVLRVSLWVIAGSFIVWATLAFASVRDYILIEEDFRVARFEAFGVGKTAASYHPPNIWVLDQLQELSKVARITAKPNMALSEIEALRRSTLRFPWTALQNRYALALALNNDTSEALRQLKVIRAMHGELVYRAIRAQWDVWGHEQYPILKSFAPQ